MPRQLHVFISYKKLADHKTPAYATQIALTLENHPLEFQVFLDDKHLRPGEKWEDRIYREIYHSDVFLVLIAPDTAKSDWVQREVDVARGAGVAILPIVIGDLTDEQIKDASHRLALEQYQYLRFYSTPEDYAYLIERIEWMALETHEQQRERYVARESQWFQAPPDLYWKALSYRMKSDLLPQTRIHITIGDVMAVHYGDLDVMVNSENDFLQMARFYQMRSISGALRRYGALFDDNQRLIEDTVQQDLCAAFNGLPPVALTRVLVTKAGHEQSVLRTQKGLKLIFHAIAVRYDVGHRTVPVQPMHDGQFIDTIKNCFWQVQAVNNNEPLRQSIAPDFEAIRSIAFPLFGTGGSVLSITNAADYMVSALYNALRAVVNEGQANLFTLTDIHLLAYSASEAKPLKEALDTKFKSI